MLQAGRKGANHFLGRGGIKHSLIGFVLVEFVDLLKGVEGSADRRKFLDYLVAYDQLTKSKVK